MSKLVTLGRSTIAVILLAALIPASGATADAESSSGEDLVYFNPVRGQWVLEGGDTLFYGVPGDSPLFCDWDGNGTATVGVYRETTGYMLLQNRNRTAVAEAEFYFGIKGDRPVCGDWDGDGIDTVAVLEPPMRGLPVGGDWDGDGAERVAFYLDGGFTITDGGSQQLIRVGEPGGNPLAGWWG